MKLYLKEIILLTDCRLDIRYELITNANKMYSIALGIEVDLEMGILTVKYKPTNATITEIPSIGVATLDPFNSRSKEINNRRLQRVKPYRKRSFLLNRRHRIRVKIRVSVPAKKKME